MREREGWGWYYGEDDWTGLGAQEVVEDGSERTVAGQQIRLRRGRNKIRSSN